MIPYGRQQIDANDIAAVEKVLKSDWLTSGPTVTEFEEALAEYVGAKYAVTFSSATAALHAACAVAGLGSGDLVHTSPLTFIASANCARYVGATPALIDIDPSTFNIDTNQITENIQAVIPVHYAGLPVELGALPTRPRVIIEDASHALGARSTTEKVGATTQKYSQTACRDRTKAKTISAAAEAITSADKKQDPRNIKPTMNTSNKVQYHSQIPRPSWNSAPHIRKR